MSQLKELKETYLKEMDLLKESCLMKMKELQKDDKTDEANFEKIKANIFDIFIILFQGEVKKFNTEAELKDQDKYTLFCSYYLNRFDTVPKAWRMRLDYADKNGLITEKVVEELKLETADIIKDIFMKASERARA